MSSFINPLTNFLYFFIFICFYTLHSALKDACYYKAHKHIIKDWYYTTLHHTHTIQVSIKYHILILWILIQYTCHALGYIPIQSFCIDRLYLSYVASVFLVYLMRYGGE